MLWCILGFDMGFFLPGKSYRGTPPPITPVEQDLSNRLCKHVSLLAGDIGARSLTSAPDNLEKAAQYIEHSFRSCGYKPATQEFSVETVSPHNREVSERGITFPAVRYQVRNIIAELPGKTFPGDVVIVGAHYDSVFECPAANDNGSGVAAMLEIARILSAEKLDRTVRFVAFPNEEPPFFRTDQMGSYHYAHSCHDKKERIVAMVCLETIGFYSDKKDSQKFPLPFFRLAYPSVGNFVSFISNLNSAPLLRKCIGSFRRAVKFPSEGAAVPAQIPGVDFSDHANFWDLGYPAVMVTDTAMYRYPYYHEAEDTPESVAATAQLM